MQKNKLLLLIFLLVLISLYSCKEHSPNISKIDVDYRLIPFYEDLFSIEPNFQNIEKEKQRLIEQYGNYFTTYCTRILGTGFPEDEDFVKNMLFFLSYEANQEVADTCKKRFNNLTKLDKEIKRAFQYYKYYFPENNIPDVYLHISGFGEFIAVDSAWVSVSVENYLGNDCVFYEWLQIYQYLRIKRKPQKIVPDIMKAIAMSDYSYNDSIDDLLSRMIYNGMILYFVKKTNYKLSEELLMDMTTKEIKWCKKYERQMWASMVEKKHLYSTDRMLIQKYVNDAPFSYYFGQDSPGRAAVFTGLKIIESYMKRNPDTTFKQLMEQRNYHKIFLESGYRP